MMFKFLSKIFGGKNPVDSVVDIVDKFHWSKEEKAEYKQKMQAFFQEAEMEMQQQVSNRWQMDMKSDSWLSKNIRPMVLIFCLISTVVLIFIDSGRIDFNVDEGWVTLLKTILTTVLFAYFGGRSIEKSINGKTQNKNNT